MIAWLFILIPFGISGLTYWRLEKATGDSDGSGAIATLVFFAVVILMTVGAVLSH